MENIISLEKISERYAGEQEFALREVCLEIPRGTIFGLLGPNGSGKTTLISILSGLLPPTEGTATIAGKVLPQQVRQVKSLLGLVPQELALYPTLTLQENLQFFGSLYGLAGSKLKSRIEKCLRITGLEKAAHKQVKRFSGGMKHRANLLVGILHKPKILFLDEPTVNIDPQSRNVIFEILKTLQKTGTSMIYTTHYIKEAETLCDYVAIIDNGVIDISGNPGKLVAENPGCRNLGEVFLQLTGKELRDST
jgi:ABC-2 type transport system ATP-binding protein